LTYENNSELNNEHDSVSRKALEIQITEYGQTPKQIFSKPHPKRFTSKVTDDFIKENNNFPATKHINFTEKDFELVQNIDESLLGSSHINIKINDEFNENEDLIIDKKDLIQNLDEENAEEEKKYFEDLENKMKFNIVSRHHKK